MLPTDLLSVVTFGLVAGSLAVALLVAGGPLLWAYLRYRPITRRNCLYAAGVFVTGSIWLIVGNGAKVAYEAGMISATTCFIAVGSMFIILGGGTFLLSRRYPNAQI